MSKTEAGTKSKQFSKTVLNTLRGLKDHHEGEYAQIKELFLFRKFAEAAPHLRGEAKPSVSGFVKSILRDFHSGHPQDALLLRQRFIEDEGIKEIALRLSASQELINRRQREAIERLSAYILHQEEQAKEDFQSLLLSSLSPASYATLFGATKILAQLEKKLLSSDPPWVISLIGIGGIGKTAILDQAVRGLIPNFPYQQLIWLRAKPNTGLMDRASLISQLSRELLSVTLPTAERPRALRAKLKARPYLIVLDNLDAEVEQLDLINFLNDLTNPSRVLLTSRTLPTPLAQIYVIPVGEMNANAAEDLLINQANARGLENSVQDLQSQFSDIYNRTGGNPLALKLVAGLLHVWSLPVVLESLELREGKDIASMYKSIYLKSWQALSESARQLLICMPLVSDEGGTLGQLAAISRLKPRALKVAVQQLAERSLVELRPSESEPRYGIHQLTETFLRNKILAWK